jgi:hypothetical protein
MTQGAKLTSIDAVQAMAAAMDAFHRDAMTALEDLSMEIRRALEWIQHDRRDHWGHEVRRGWERTAEARVQLQQAMTFRRIGDRDPSCIDEKKALEKTKRRLEVAQEKVEMVRQWCHVIEREVNEYRVGRGQLGNWLDADFPRAMAVLKNMTRVLENYVATATPADITARTAEASQALDKVFAEAECLGEGEGTSGRQGEQPAGDAA